MIIVILPFVAFTAIYFAFLGHSDERAASDIRDAFVASLVVWGVLLVAGMEILSPLDGVRQVPLALFWGSVALAAIVCGGGTVGMRRAWRRLSECMRALARAEWIAVAVLGLLSACLFVTAVVSPPNNVDSLNVHMPKVVHMAQNHSIAIYYATSRSQLTRPPFAEIAILNLRTLFGSDRPAALVQWFSFLGCVLVATAVAARLGASRLGQLVAAAFVASIPLAVLEATNTKNDLVVGLWVVCTAYYAVTSGRRPLRRTEVLLAGGAIGLGLLTKGTYQPAALPFVCWLFVSLLRKSGWRKGLVAVLAIGGVTLLLNTGYWVRNVLSFGSPYGTLAGLGRALEIDEILPPPSLSPGEGLLSTETIGTAPALEDLAGEVETNRQPWPFLSRAASLLTLHTIYPEVGGPMRSFLARTGGLYSPGFLASLDEGLWNHEDSAGGLLSILLAIAASVWAVGRAVRKREGILGIYVLAAWLGWSLLTLITNSIQLWGVRYQLSHLILCAAIVGVVSGWMRREFGLALLALLTLAAVPYALMNNTRPWIGMPSRTRSSSIFVTSGADLLFTSTPEVEEQYRRATDQLRSSTCRQVGLDLGRRDLEYSLWWLLDAPQSGFRLEVLRGTEGPRDLSGADFRPCAVLCTQCRDLQAYLGLPLRLDGGFLRLYAAEGV